MTRAAVLAGLGGFLPPRAVSNDDLAASMDTTDAWIRSRTGITRRYFAEAGSTTSDLAVGAGELALKSSGRTAVDALVLATTTPDRPCPATAPVVADRLGLSGIAAYDVAAVCTGFVYALANAAGLIAAGIAERVLVIGAETFSTIVNPNDRSTAVIFGDGAGAVVLRAGQGDEPGAFGAFDLGSDGADADLITVRGGGAAERLSGAPANEQDRYFSMAGREVFRRAVEHMAESTRSVLGRAGWTPADLDWLVCHQANLRIVLSLAGQLGLDAARAVTNIAQVGNTSAASIPLALAHAHAAGVFSPGDKLALTAFGGGLTWGSTTLTWPDITVP
ncbi:MAG TPA: beta-ketoacyl-ACP synthase III [Actinospica sp.]|jgi:3-oxoacyl-[acyl-carrier-protein] synthase-3|nr:beta-ketoacyl-ACP synthase III [Actinospica sp.]